MSRRRATRSWSNTVGSSSLWNIGQAAYSLGTTALVTALAARHYGPIEFGGLNLVLAASAILYSVSSFGIETLLIARHSQKDVTPDLLRSSLAFRLLTSAIAGIALVLTVLMLSPDNTVRSLAIIFGLVYIARASEVLICLFLARQAMRMPALTRIVSTTVGCALRLLVLKSDSTLVEYGLTYLAESALATALLILAHKKLGIGFGPSGSRRTVMLLLKTGWPLMIGSLAVVAYRRVDQILLAVLSDDTASIGLYAAAVTLSEVWYFLPAALIAAHVPLMSVGELSAARAAARRLYVIVISISGLLAVAVALFAAQLIALLYGAEFTESADVLRILAVGSLFAMLGMAQNAFLVARGLQRAALLIALSGLSINVCLNLMLVPSLGIVGAAVASSAAQIAACILVPLLNAHLRVVAIDVMLLLIGPTNRGIREEQL